jgi:tetratricopeptide (TPR) repeat protein
MSVNPILTTLNYANFLIDTLDNPQNAISILEKGVREYSHSPQRQIWYRKIGDILLLESLWDDAILQYEQLLSEYPNDWRAYLSLGWAYYNQGNNRVAIEQFQQAITISPNTADGYLAIGQMMEMEQRYKDADEWFQKALFFEPNNRIIYLYRANAARSDKNFPLAISVYQKAIELFPDWPNAYYELAWAYQMMGETEKALDSIDISLDLNTDPSFWYYLRAGAIYEWAGKKQKAFWAYEQALKINPDNQSAKSGIERISP